MKSHLPLVFAFVLTAAFLLLLLTFRSIVIPIKAILLNLLSVAAAYGVLVWIFQDGHLQSLLGFPLQRRNRPVDAAIPVRGPVGKVSRMDHPYLLRVSKLLENLGDHLAGLLEPPRSKKATVAVGRVGFKAGQRQIPRAGNGGQPRTNPVYADAVELGEVRDIEGCALQVEHPAGWHQHCGGRERLGSVPELRDAERDPDRRYLGRVALLVQGRPAGCDDPARLCGLHRLPPMWSCPRTFVRRGGASIWGAPGTIVGESDAKSYAKWTAQLRARHGLSKSKKSLRDGGPASSSSGALGRPQERAASERAFEIVVFGERRSTMSIELCQSSTSSSEM
jgi:hypothetical protein